MPCPSAAAVTSGSVDSGVLPAPCSITSSRRGVDRAGGTTRRACLPGPTAYTPGLIAASSASALVSAAAAPVSAPRGRTHRREGSGGRAAIAPACPLPPQPGEDRSVLFDLLPPLAPPLVPDEDPQLRVPAVRDRVVRVEVVQAVGALLLAVGLALQDGPLGEVPELDPVLLVDLLRLGLRDLVVAHRSGGSSSAPGGRRRSTCSQRGPGRSRRPPATDARYR